MKLISVYFRAIAQLASEWWLAAGLTFANVAIGIVQLAEPILFGKVVDALAQGTPVFKLISLWAVVGIFGIVTGVTVAVASDRLAHRQRLAAMSRAFERTLTLPISYLAERGTGATVRTIVAGTDALFATWLTFMREQLSAIVSVLCLVPTAIYMDWRLASLLAVLAVIYTILNVTVVYRTSDGQASVERYYVDVFGRVGD
ncbi:MAG TPA: ABC transporter transmembrane domain-containing protein, partial [Hyphomicrobiaceae bacterium]|nr:ABC transporter transmembrane domain-containing protein [Hyphomicrobiaceae bacterium]